MLTMFGPKVIVCWIYRQDVLQEGMPDPLTAEGFYLLRVNFHTSS